MTEEPHKLTPTERPERLTLSGELQRAWDLLAATILKPPHRGSESTTYTRPSTGALAGRTVLKHEAVRGEGEEWDDYRARCGRQWAELNADALDYDAKSITRDLAATLEKGAKP